MSRRVSSTHKAIKFLFIFPQFVYTTLYEAIKREGDASRLGDSQQALNNPAEMG